MIEKTMLNFISLVDDKYLEEACPMKKPKKNFGWKKITAIAASVCIAVTTLFVSLYIPLRNTPPPSLDNKIPETTKLEWGFKNTDGGGNGCGQPSNRCAYRSETNTFDMDNVTLTFYFGGHFLSDINDHLENVENIPGFDIYFCDYNNEFIYTIRHSTQNFVSEEYRVTPVYDENYYVTEYVFNHSEIITIPKELFCEEQGVIYFCIGGINVNKREPEYQIIVSVGIKYDVVNGKVLLSSGGYGLAY